MSGVMRDDVSAVHQWARRASAIRRAVRDLWPAASEFEDVDDLVRATRQKTSPFASLLNFADRTWLLYVGPRRGRPWITLGGMRLRPLMLNLLDRPIWESPLIADDCDCATRGDRDDETESEQP